MLHRFSDDAVVDDVLLAEFALQGFQLLAHCLQFLVGLWGMIICVHGGVVFNRLTFVSAALGF